MKITTCGRGRAKQYSSLVAFYNAVKFTISGLELAIAAGSIQWVDSPFRAHDIASSLESAPAPVRSEVIRKLAKIESRIISRCYLLELASTRSVRTQDVADLFGLSDQSLRLILHSALETLGINLKRSGAVSKSLNMNINIRIEVA